MSLAVKVCLAIGVVFVLCGITCVGSVISTNNELVSQEQGLQAQYDQDRNAYDNMFKKFAEVSQVPSMYTEDLKKVYDSAIQNRYGKDGSKAMFQWIQEHNPAFDSSVYRQIQQVVEAGRNSFEAEQKMLLDKKRVYLTQLNQFPTSFVARLLGFPKIDLKKIDILTSEDTERAFTTKKTDPIKLR